MNPGGNVFKRTISAHMCPIRLHINVIAHNNSAAFNNSPASYPSYGIAHIKEKLSCGKTANQMIEFSPG